MRNYLNIQIYYLTLVWFITIYHPDFNFVRRIWLNINKIEFWEFLVIYYVQYQLFTELNNGKGKSSKTDLNIAIAFFLFMITWSPTSFSGILKNKHSTDKYWNLITKYLNKWVKAKKVDSKKKKTN